MPELPEVETIRKIICKQVQGAVISDICIYNKNSLDNIRVNTFVDGVAGSTIVNIERRGKYFIFNLSSGTMVIHLRLNGMLHVDESKDMPKYGIMSFILSDGRVLHLCDARKFAKVSFIPKGVEDTVSGIHKLGIEPFDRELTIDYLKRYWRFKSGTVKEALMEQDVIAGFGNLYSDDILFYCGIYPMKRCINLTDSNYADLVKTIPDIMMNAIMMNNVQEEDYVKIRNHDFGASKHTWVYGRDGKPCRVCGTIIQSVKLGGRTCRYCPACQRRVKIVPDEVNSDMLFEVAKYIGICIESGLGFNPNDIPSGVFDLSDTINVSWEHFVWCVYKYIMTEDAFTVSDQRFGEWRRNKVLAIYNMNDSHFNTGINWIKSQRWREE